MQQQTMLNQGMAMDQGTTVNRESSIGQTAIDHEKTMGQELKNCQVRRVGSVTFGITLVCYGILFLVHIFAPMLKYHMIFRCWPIIFILLGGEILVENHKCRVKEWKMVYDFAAVLMLGAMLLFAMVMAVIDYTVTYGPIYF